ncbi:conserved Plasmodium protein, unknown function [Plasmodium gallinaceum]|uniref:Uncharacterized protein n=1 Tax=Plasmodium gallinaceum TaxID=5849 RepID=A0A1J1GMY0_PLAGA|nr:conserved Plasmodium protein, unknown function [Plasmodium gallinaceum]CRG93716.1 conserved Plasmodium protein, unknown function [Plasmodium gallinaceum]
MCNQKKCDQSNLNKETNDNDINTLKNEKKINDINNQKTKNVVNHEQNVNDSNKEQNVNSNNNFNNEKNISDINNLTNAQITNDLNNEKNINEKNSIDNIYRDNKLKDEKHNDNEYFLINTEINDSNIKNNLIYNANEFNIQIEENQNKYIKKENNYLENILTNVDNKKIIIENNKQINNKNDNFNYLKDILEQTYKVCIDFDGSEYIYIYDICIKNENIENEKIKINSITYNDKKEDIMVLNVYDIYMNFFSKISMKINKIKRLFSNIKIKKIKSTISDNTLNLSNEITNIINNKKVKINNFLKKENEGDHLRNNGRNKTDNKMCTLHSFFSDEQKITFFQKKKFIDKLNYIFFSIFKNNKEYNHIKEIRNNHNFEEIHLEEIKNNMKKSINGRICNIDINDIKIIKKGYTFIFIKNVEWKLFFCVLFYLKNNNVYKNDIIFKHYCKIYDREYFLNILKSSDLNSNCFLAFFEDMNFHEDEKSNLELCKLIRRNNYELILEISKSKKSEIINSFHYIYVGNHIKTKNYLKIYDINYNPFCLIPFEFLSKDTNNNKNVNSLRQINFNYGILKEWNNSIYLIKEKIEYRNNSIYAKNEKNEQLDYVNKKLNQWIKLFKQERNINNIKKLADKNE